MSSSSVFPARCQNCGQAASTQLNGVEWYCARCLPGSVALVPTPMTDPLAGRPEDLAEILALREQLAAAEKFHQEQMTKAVENGNVLIGIAQDRARRATAERDAALAVRPTAVLDRALAAEKRIGELQEDLFKRERADVALAVALVRAEKLAEALKFYADFENYVEPYDRETDSQLLAPVILDEGKCAAAALKGKP